MQNKIPTNHMTKEEIVSFVTYISDYKFSTLRKMSEENRLEANDNYKIIGAIKSGFCKNIPVSSIEIYTKKAEILMEKVWIIERYISDKSK